LLTDIETPATSTTAPAEGEGGDGWFW
jgi:hypothetical protein